MEFVGDHGVELVDWRIYYDDGSTFDSDQGTPNDAPPVGVILILQRDLLFPNNTERIVGENYYYWAGPTMQWQGSDRDGLVDRLLERKDVEGVCQGRRLSREDFHAIHRAASNDSDFY